jgi:hypothetical protein
VMYATAERYLNKSFAAGKQDLAVIAAFANQTRWIRNVLPNGAAARDNGGEWEIPPLPPGNKTQITWVDDSFMCTAILSHAAPVLKVQCAFSDEILHSRMPLVPTPARLKLLHACDQ